MKDSRQKSIAFYFGLIALLIGAGWFILKTGSTLFPTIEMIVEPTRGEAPHFSTVFKVLLALSSIIVVTQLMGAFVSKFKQPSVVGEIIGGIMLGPSLLGWIAPSFSQYLIPTSISPLISIIAQIGVIFYMFLVGLELDLSVIKKKSEQTLLISHASIVFPMLLGLVLALVIYKHMAEPHVNFNVFALFMAVSMSVTAFPVLARILHEKQLSKTKLGMTTITCAAIDDVSAWCLLAIVVSFTQSNLTSAFMTIFYTILYILVMLILFKPMIHQMIGSMQDRIENDQTPIVLILLFVLLSAVATEWIGIHAIFGAFLFGAVIPHDSKVAHELGTKLEVLVKILFLPAFFAYTGMRTEIGLLSSINDWLICLLIIFLATVGKIGGTYFAARFTGESKRDAMAMGILMNTRGLVELIVLNIGLDLKIISPILFTMLVIMALVTTFMTGPLLTICLGPRDAELAQ